MAKTEGPSTIFLKDYRPSAYKVKDVHLTFKFDAESVLVENVMQLEFQGTESRTLDLDGVNLILKAIFLNGRELKANEYVLDHEKLTLENPPDNFELKVVNEIFPKKNFALEGLYLSGGVYCTQNEPQGFRKITYFVDRPDVMAKYTTTIIASKSELPLLLANGNKVDSGLLEDGRHFATWVDPFPKPSYLFALVAGDLGLVEDWFVTKSGRKVKLEIYVDRGNEDKCAHAMESLKKSMKWDEDTFGLEYDLDIYMIVAVDSFNFGAMENKGLNIFNSAYVLAKRETATDDNFLGIEGVVAHEYFHNWTGNRVTCRDWFQLTLKEGLTVFRDQEFSADMNSRSVKRIQDVRTLKEAQFPEDNGPLSHPIRPESYIQINNFYTATVYEKGAEVIRMIQTIIGQDNFRKGITKYFELFDGLAVTTDDFVKAMELVSNVDLTLFKNWYKNSGTPTVKIDLFHDREKNIAELTCTQNASVQATGEKLLLHIPLVVGFLNEEGNNLLVNGQKDFVLHLKNKVEKFKFNLEAKSVIPSLNRDFSAPVFIEYDYNENDLCHLLAFDENLFNKNEAAQLLWDMELHRQIRSFQNNQTPMLNEKLIKSIKHLLENALVDPAFTVEALTFPSEEILNEKLTVCDFKNVALACKNLKKQLANTFKTKLLSITEEARENDFKLSPNAMGKRALRNLCWDLLEQLNDDELKSKVTKEFYAANNMTDEISAFALIMAREDQSSEEAKKHFYNKWKSETLVMQKWMTVQAVTMRANVIEKLKTIELDQVYDSKVPNIVRALVGRFVTSNLESFHHENGEGYRYLADKIRELDTVNPQLASRLATRFKRFKNLDNNRNVLIEKNLKELLAISGLSKDTYEVVSRNLAK